MTSLTLDHMDAEIIMLLAKAKRYRKGSAVCHDLYFPVLTSVTYDE